MSHGCWHGGIRAHISKRKGGIAPQRFLYIFAFCADFNEFWRGHLFKKLPDAPLFYREDNKRYLGQPLKPAGANKMLKRVDFRSGVRKNGSLYFLRRGGYTWKRLEGMNPAIAGKEMGWVPGGTEERRYLHLEEADVLNERLRLNQSKTVQLPQPTTKAKTCSKCGNVNSPTDDRCLRCGKSLGAVGGQAQTTPDMDAKMREMIQQILQEKGVGNNENQSRRL